jgi:LysM repeat protein
MPEPTEAPEETEPSGYYYEWTTNQLEWAHDKHIKWDEYGNPVDENNVVIDDPTTMVNEVERARANGTLADDGTSRAPVIEEPEPEPEPETEPETEEPEEDTAYIDELLKNPNISKDEDGNLIYTVQRGQTLSDIAKETGYSVAELAEYNKLESPSMIVTGQKLKLPPHPPTSEVGVSGAGLG